MKLTSPRKIKSKNMHFRWQPCQYEVFSVHIFHHQMLSLWHNCTNKKHCKLHLYKWHFLIFCKCTNCFVRKMEVFYKFLVQSLDLRAAICTFITVMLGKGKNPEFYNYSTKLISIYVRRQKKSTEMEVTISESQKKKKKRKKRNSLSLHCQDQW